MKVFKYTHGVMYPRRDYAGLYFISTYPLKDGETLKTMTEIRNCREFFTLTLQERIRRNLGGTDKAYALITSGLDLKHKHASKGAKWLDLVKNSMFILNTFEKHYGIPLSKMYPVTCDMWAGNSFIIGSKRWTQSRYSFGLWTLFFRLGILPDFKTPTIMKLLSGMKWPEMLDRIVESTPINSTTNQARAIFTDRRVDVFFDFEKKYLSDRHKAWNPSIIRYDMQRSEGIARLLSGYSHSPDLKTKWREFYHDWKNNHQKGKEAV